MTKRIISLVLVSQITLLAPAAVAQSRCPEGQTASGACVDPELGSTMRERVRVFTQPRLSYTGPAVAPSTEKKYEVLRDWGEALRRETFGPCTAQFCPP
jgi:hypothetical protein